MEQKEGGGAETIESLTEKLADLNKGIAKYRDDAQTANKSASEAKAEAKAAKEEADKIRKAIEESKDPDDKEVVLSPADQKKLDAWAKAQGFTTKAELDAQQSRIFNENLKSVETTAVNEFLEKHPELNKDEEWKKIGEQFALYKQPTSLTGYRQILNRMYKDVYGDEDASAKARAAIETRKRLAMGGGNQKAEDQESQLDELHEKYPNLSREQISDRLKEINDLAEERAKKKASKK